MRFHRGTAISTHPHIKDLALLEKLLDHAKVSESAGLERLLSHAKLRDPALLRRLLDSPILGHGAQLEPDFETARPFEAHSPGGIG